jgi:hypothetical protein
MLSSPPLTAVLPTAAAGPLVRLLAAREAAAWLDGALADTGLHAPPFDEARFFSAFSGAGRRLGKAPATLTGDERGVLARDGIDWRLDAWCVDELGRAVLLLEAFRVLSPPPAAALLAACYARADNRERQAILRVLPLLPDARRFVALAVDACRSSVQTVFEAIACENPFPARHFADASFHQMVLKSMFNGVALRRVVGLAQRRTPELTRMATDYAAERRAAGRSVPADIDLALVTSSSPAQP